MSKFISIVAANDSACLINCEHIICVFDKVENSLVSIVLDQDIFKEHNCIETKESYSEIIKKITA